jgi:hypothetical protein
MFFLKLLIFALIHIRLVSNNSDTGDHAYTTKMNKSLRCDVTGKLRKLHKRAVHNLYFIHLHIYGLINDE